MRRAVRSEVGNYDRVVIQEILKEIAQTQQVDLNAKQRFKGASLPSLLLRLLVPQCSMSKLPSTPLNIHIRICVQW